jgi:7-cyano-7-deazaguanine reductase
MGEFLAYNLRMSENATSLLVTFENPYPGRDYVIQHVAPEFTSVCPVTGHPDFGTIRLTYVADKVCVELKSYKLYLQSFRNKGIFYEAVTNQILDDLVKLLQPRSMTIVTEWTPRGGLHSIITATYARDKVTG